jgi:hypothetical protein
MLREYRVWYKYNGVLSSCKVRAKTKEEARRTFIDQNPKAVPGRIELMR